MKFSIEYIGGTTSRGKMIIKNFTGIATSEERALERFEKFREKNPDIRPTGSCSYKWSLKDFPYGDNPAFKSDIASKGGSFNG